LGSLKKLNFKRVTFEHVTVIDKPTPDHEPLEVTPEEEKCSAGEDLGIKRGENPAESVIARRTMGGQHDEENFAERGA
jgi:hypothetical protein